MIKKTVLAVSCMFCSSLVSCEPPAPVLPIKGSEEIHKETEKTDKKSKKTPQEDAGLRKIFTGHMIFNGESDKEN